MELLRLKGRGDPSQERMLRVEGWGLGVCVGGAVLGSVGVRTCALPACCGRTLDGMSVDMSGMNRKCHFLRAVKGS